MKTTLTDLHEITVQEIKLYSKLVTILIKESFVFTDKEYAKKHFPEYFF